MQTSGFYSERPSSVQQSLKSKAQGRIGAVILILLVLALLIASLSWLQWSSQRGITLGYATPRVHILTAPSNPTVGQSNTFAADATGRELTFIWTFGDQDYASGASVSHTYTSVGTFTASVTVTDGIGQSSYEAHTVIVAPRPPVASFTASVSYSGYVSFDASTSSADSSTSITAYYWDFGDGITDSTAYSQDSHSYTNTGTYAVRLIVTDATGQQSNPFTGTVVIS